MRALKHPQLWHFVGGFQSPAFGNQSFSFTDVITLVGPVLHHALVEHIGRQRARHRHVPVPTQQAVTMGEFHIRFPVGGFRAPIYRHSRIPHFFFQ